MTVTTNICTAGLHILKEYYGLALFDVTTYFLVNKLWISTIVWFACFIVCSSLNQITSCHETIKMARGDNTQHFLRYESYDTNEWTHSVHICAIVTHAFQLRL